MAIVPEERQRLNSWKEIADFLGVSVRAAQRWEAERGLPVHRLPGTRGPVHVDADELREWQRKRESNGGNGAGEEGQAVFDGRIAEGKKETGNPAGIRRLSETRKLSSAIALLFLVLGATAIWWGWFKPGPPVSWEFNQNILIVRDKRGDELWKSSFPTPLHEKYYRELLAGLSPKPQFVDLDDDGEVELLFEEQAQEPGTHPDVLTCFSEGGSIKWRFIPGKAVATKSKSYQSNYDILNFLPVRTGPGRPYSIIVSSTHYPNHVCQVVLLSPSGEIQREYWHSGHIGHPSSLQVADRNHDGRSEIYLGGVNNGSSNQATLVVLDPDSFEGASEEEDPQHQWIGMAPGRELARVLFPRSCLNIKELEYNYVNALSWSNDLLVVHVVETESPGSTIMYKLDAGLNPVDVNLTDTFRGNHKTMEMEKTIDHPLGEQEISSFHRLRYLTPIRPK
jgi:hypothetical protein